LKKYCDKWDVEQKHEAVFGILRKSGYPKFKIILLCLHEWNDLQSVKKRNTLYKNSINVVIF